MDLDEKLDEISQFMDELNEKSDELKSRIASLLTDMKSDRREGSWSIHENTEWEYKTSMIHMGSQDVIEV